MGNGYSNVPSTKGYKYLEKREQFKSSEFYTQIMKWQNEGSDFPEMVAPRPAVFDDIAHNRVGCKTVIYKDVDFVVLLPFNPFNNDNLGIKPVSFNKQQLQSRLSYGHIIVLPRNAHIYNALTLDLEHIGLIERMKKVGKAVITALLIADPCNTNGDVEQITPISSLDDPLIANNTGQYIPGGLGLSASTAQDLVETIEYSFNSVDGTKDGYLHLHVFVGGMATRCFDETPESHLISYKEVKDGLVQLWMAENVRS